MDTSNLGKSVARLEMLADDPQVHRMNKAGKLISVTLMLFRNDPNGFKQLDNLTWPEGQAILLASSREQIVRTNKTAQIKEIYTTPYFIDTGHDNAAIHRLVGEMMRRLGYEPGIINRLKNLFTTTRRFRGNDFSRNERLVG
jgi:negative regulator of replication initiation